MITVAWEISWYQYRVGLGSSQPIRLAERGYEIDELDPRFKELERVVRRGRAPGAGHPEALSAEAPP